eukprot:10650105-Prorocentrum_lima.AAC.1
MGSMAHAKATANAPPAVFHWSTTFASLFLSAPAFRPPFHHLSSSSRRKPESGTLRQSTGPLAAGSEAGE